MKRDSVWNGWRSFVLELVGPLDLEHAISEYLPASQLLPANNDFRVLRVSRVVVPEKPDPHYTVLWVCPENRVQKKHPIFDDVFH